jgi:energy-coupling factor transporter ATP-binding protein EcfA2
VPPAPPSPAQIAKALEKRVVGQKEAVREMSVALSKKLAGLKVGNILLIGPSGSGKTTLMRAVEELLASNPALWVRSTVVRIHANVLGEEAEHGHPGEKLLLLCLHNRGPEPRGYTGARIAIELLEPWWRRGRQLRCSGEPAAVERRREPVAGSVSVCRKGRGETVRVDILPGAKVCVLRDQCTREIHHLPVRRIGAEPSLVRVCIGYDCLEGRIELMGDRDRELREARRA